MKSAGCGMRDKGCGVSGKCGVCGKCGVSGKCVVDGEKSMVRVDSGKTCQHFENRMLYMNKANVWFEICPLLKILRCVFSLQSTTGFVHNF